MLLFNLRAPGRPRKKSASPFADVSLALQYTRLPDALAASADPRSPLVLESRE